MQPPLAPLLYLGLYLPAASLAFQCCVGRQPNASNFAACVRRASCTLPNKCYSVVGLNTANGLWGYIQNCSEPWPGQAIVRRQMGAYDCTHYSIRQQLDTSSLVNVWECGCAEDNCNNVDPRQKLPSVNLLLPDAAQRPVTTTSSTADTATSTATATAYAIDGGNYIVTTTAATITTAPVEAGNVGEWMLYAVAIAVVCALLFCWVWSCVDRACNRQCTCSRGQQDNVIHVKPDHNQQQQPPTSQH